MRRLAILVAAALVGSACSTAAVLAFYHKEFVERLTPRERQFYQSLERPDNRTHERMSCCNESDCHETEEDIREDHYWARIGKLENDVWILGMWVEIPDQRVIKKPNLVGYPVICENNNAAFATPESQIPLSVAIYCYVPGAKL